MKWIVILPLVGLLFVGCNSKVLLPYEDEPLCKRGAGEGMCGSVSEIYAKTSKANYGD